MPGPRPREAAQKFFCFFFFKKRSYFAFLVMFDVAARFGLPFCGAQDGLLRFARHDVGGASLQ
jgi:hypothetical protein